MHCDIILLMRIATIADKLARWLLIVLAFSIPFFVLPVSWAQVAQDKTLLLVVVLSLTLIAFVVARIAAGTLLIPRHPLLFASALLPIAYLASALGSHATIGSYVSGFGATDTVAAMTIFFATIALYGLIFSGKEAMYPLLALAAGVAIIILFPI